MTILSGLLDECILKGQARPSRSPMHVYMHLIKKTQEGAFQSQWAIRMARVSAQYIQGLDFYQNLSRLQLSPVRDPKLVLCCPAIHWPEYLSL